MPVPARVAAANIGFAGELAVRNIDQAIGDGDADVHALGLVAPLILVGPPDAGARAFAGGVDPDLACQDRGLKVNAPKRPFSGGWPE